MIINFLIKSLCEKESVYVSNLGLFRKEYEPAHIIDGMITPPGYKVVYDPNYDGNGFAFTMFVSQKGGMLITDATAQIDQWVSQLKTALSNNKSVSFENFGTFALNDKGVITYVCDRIAELNMEYEGMEPVAFSIQKGKNVVTEDEGKNESDTKEEEEKSDRKNGAIDSSTGDSGDTGETDNTKGNEDNNTEGKIEDKSEEQTEDGNKPDTKENEDEVENGEEEDKEDNDNNEGGKENTEEGKTKKNRGWIWLVILLLLALMAAAAYYFKDQLCELYKQYFGQTTEAVVEDTPSVTEPEVNTTDTLVVDSLTLNQDSLQAAEQTGDKDNSEAEETLSNPQNQIQKTSQLPDGEKFFINFEQGKHYVIVGSFRNENEVRQHIKQRKLEQYNPKVVLQPNSKQMRICIGVFDTEAAADSYGRSTGLNYWVLN